LAQAECTPEGIYLTAEDGTQLQAATVVNAAGLHAQQLAARFAGLPTRHVPPSHYAKGNYFTLPGRSPFSRLIYPVPEAAGLGVHLTVDMGGQAKFGPDVQWVDSPDDLVVDPSRGDAFTPRCANTGPRCPTARSRRATPAYGPKSRRRMKPPKTS
jgi:L-2-hydroxyglutarate oxidase LhgO